MKPKPFAGVRTALYVLGGCVAVLVLAAAIFVLTFDINSYKPRIEAAASRATGMKVLINGRMRLALFPGASISFEDLEAQGQDADVASVRKAALKIDPWPLLKRELVVQQVDLDAPEVFIIRLRTGRFNFETSGKEARPGPVAIQKLSVRGGSFLYLDEETGRKFEASGCDMYIRNLSAGGSRFFETLSFGGDLSCAEARAGGIRFTGIRAAVKARGGTLEADPVTADVFGGDGIGRVQLDAAGESPKCSVTLSVEDLRLEDVLASYNQKKTVRGEVDVKARLEMEGGDLRAMKRTARGEVSLRGHDLLLDSVDIDRLLEKYERSRGVGIIDVGSFFVLGPLGPLLTKSYEFGDVYEGSLGGKSRVRVLVSDWKIGNGVAEAKDVAFATDRNRVALKGGLDFVHERFKGVNVAVLDEKGCAKYSERVHGRFWNPEVEKPGALATMVSPVTGLLKEAEGLVTGGKCEVFYTGSVKQPL